jgi:hypothetical protein
MAYMVHGLKTLPEYFQEVINGNKTFEVRRNDRDYCVGDVLFLNEYDAERKEYSGRRTRLKVTYITNYAQVEDYVVMGIKLEQQQMMKVVRVAYFANGFQRVSFVAGINEKRAENLVRKEFDVEDNFELYSIRECDISSENIIHTEVIEIV